MRGRCTRPAGGRSRGLTVRESHHHARGRAQLCLVARAGSAVAIAMLVAGFALHQNDPTIAVRTLNGVIRFIAPQVAQYDQLTATPQVCRCSTASSRAAVPAPWSLGALTLIVIVIQLFTSVENAFTPFGACAGAGLADSDCVLLDDPHPRHVLFFLSLTALSAAAFFNVFIEKLPFGFGDELLKGLALMLPGFIGFDGDCHPLDFLPIHPEHTRPVAVRVLRRHRCRRPALS